MKRLASLGPAILVACGGSTGPNAQGIEGTYQLQSVNGAALPYTSFHSTSETDEVVAGTIQLNSDGSYFEGAVFSIVRSGVPSSDKTNGGGTYTRTGDRIDFKSGPATYSATLSGTTLTYTNCLPAVTCPRNSLVAVYKK